MALTISGTTLTGINVNTTADNPIMILPSAYVSNGGIGKSGLTVNGNTNWTITNSGRVIGANAGVYMGNTTPITNGTIVNTILGQVAGGHYGINVQGTITIRNAGSILGGIYGIEFEHGSAFNQSTGTVTGSGGITDLDGTGSVTNAGLVLGTEGSAVRSDGGNVTNLVGGTITAVSVGVDLVETATVANAGLITGGYGVDMERGGTVTNQSGGVIIGSTFGVRGYLLPEGGTYTATVMNGGMITASTAVYLDDGGTVGNLALADIAGANYGVSIKSGPGDVTNAGIISGTTVAGILIGDGGGVSNQSGGTISGPIGIYGYLFTAAVTVTNAGLISGTVRYGVWLRGGGGVTNLSTGTVTGGTDGIVGGGTVFNAGTIGGGNYAVDFYVGSNDRLIVAPGAVVSGKVNGGNAVGGAAVSTLELASAATTGQLSGLGTKFTNFAQIAVDAGAQWTLSAANTLAAGTTLTNLGALTIFDGSLIDAGAVIDDGLIQMTAATMGVGTLTGTGELLIGGESTLAAVGSVAAGATIAFAGTGLLGLVPSTFSGQIDGLGGGGRIELIGIADATSATIVHGNTLAIAQSAGPTLDLTLDPDQSYAGMVFPIISSGENQLIDASNQVGPTVIDQGETESLTGAAAATLAAVVGGTGGITVSGPESLLIATTGIFTIGDTGLGSLSIEAGGSADAQNGMIIANTTSASGSSVNLSGAGSNLSVTGTLVVGDAGSGALSLSQGASVTVGALDVAAAATGAGEVSLAGATTTLIVTGALTLGDQAAGELSVLGGAQMTIGGGVVGSSHTAPGNLDVEGSGSQLTINTGTLVVGANGPAEFTLGIGATLSGEVANGPFGVVSDYGNVDPATDPNDGTQNVGFGNSLIYDYYVANSGTIKITSGTATFYTPLVTDETNAADSSTSGLWVIGAHETLVMNATSVDATQVFDLTSASAATLVIGQVPQASATQTDTFNGQTMPALTGSVAPGAANVLPGWDAPIENFASGDLIVLRGLSYGSATSSGDVVTVWSGAPNTSSALGNLTFLTKSGAPSTSQAALAATQINSLACFATGTRIATPEGWAAVETLRIGDEVTTAAGRREPIVWVGSRTVDCAKHPHPETVWPVQISVGAFGDNTPSRALYLSPDHAVFVNGVLIPIKRLINGTSIVQMPRHRVTYHHLELPEHTVILAEALPVESYLDIGDRANFDGTGTIRLFPDFARRSMPRAAMLWETKGAAPLVTAGPALTAARRTIAADAANRTRTIDRHRPDRRAAN